MCHILFILYMAIYNHRSIYSVTAADATTMRDQASKTTCNITVCKPATVLPKFCGIVFAYNFFNEVVCIVRGGVRFFLVGSAVPRLC